MVPAAQVATINRALPFWLSLTLIPPVLAAAGWGGWWILSVPLVAWSLFIVLDAITGRYEEDADLETPLAGLFWYRLITLIWFPIQFAIQFGLIWYATRADHLSGIELVGLFFGVGVLAGTVGINYSHELMHQKNRWERLLGDLLLASVLYSHFRSEHLRVHHLWVGTPRDPVSARYNEGFFHFFPRVLTESPRSAWKAETAMLARKGAGPWHLSNPFWRYAALQALMLALAFALGGPLGLGLFLMQAFTAIWQLELVNYVEHYGLTRKHLGEGKYEHVQPRHSWNATQKASNWLLINLQRHSDHHYKPDRRFPLLQNYGEDEAPLLPYGYPVMTLMALVPPLWLRRMNPRVREWRQRFYPEIEDWTPYNRGDLPQPRGA